MFKFRFKDRGQVVSTVLPAYMQVSTGLLLFSVVNLTYASLSLTELNQKVSSYQNTSTVWQKQQDILQLERKDQLTWQNPTLTVQQTGFKNSQEQELEIAISQPIDIFSVRRKAADLVDLHAEQVALLEKNAQQEQALALEYFWVQLHLFSQEVDLLEQQLHMSKENLDATRQRFKAGSIAQLDVERVEIQHLELQASYEQQAQALQLMKRQLSNTWGENTTSYTLSTLESLTKTSLSDQQSQTDEIKSNINVRLMQLQNLQSEAQLAYLKAQAKPMPTLSFGIVSVQDAESKAKDQQVRVGLELPLAIFQRQQYKQQIESIKMHTVAQAQPRYQKNMTLAKSRLETEYSVLYEQYQHILKQQIPLVKSIKEKTLLGFMAGKYTVTEVQLATSSLQQRQLQALQIKKQLWSKYLEQKALLLGIKFEQISNLNAVADLNQNIWRNSNSLPMVGGE